MRRFFFRDSQRGAFLSRGVLRPAGKVDQAWQQDLDKSVSFLSRDNNQLFSEFCFDRTFFQVPRSFRHDRGDAVLAGPAPERAETHTCPRLGQRLTIKGQDLSFCAFVKHYPSGWGVFLFLARRSFSISPSSRIKPGWLFVVAFLLQIWILCRRFHSAP